MHTLQYNEMLLMQLGEFFAWSVKRNKTIKHPEKRNNTIKFEVSDFEGLLSLETS